MKKRELFTALKLSEKLIKIEITQIRKISKASSYKKEVMVALNELFSYFECMDSKYINEIYQLEEDKLKIEHSFFSKIKEKDNLELNVSKDSMEFAVDVFCDLLDIVSNDIYYISIFSTKKPDVDSNYKLERSFWNICEKFALELDLPISALTKIGAEKERFRTKIKQKVKNLEELPGYLWLEDKKLSLKEYSWDTMNNKNDVVKYLEGLKKPKTSKSIDLSDKDLFSKYFDEKNKPLSSKTAEFLQRKWKDTIDMISETSHFDKEKNTFNSLGHFTFGKLINKDVLLINKGERRPLIEKDISKEISNQNILKLLSYFKELGLKGSLIDHGEEFEKIGTPQGYKNLDGEIYYEKMIWSDCRLDDITIELGLKTKWNSEHNHILEEFLLSIGFNLSNLIYTGENPVIKI